jgi:hypothetical protein
MKYLFVCLVSIVLSGCATGYKFPENARQERLVSMVAWVQSENVSNICRSLGVKERYYAPVSQGISAELPLIACSVQRGDSCTIYTATLKNVSESDLGHEVAHCFLGAFH